MEKTHFGYETVTPDEKTEKVGKVFQSVAPKYDLMNDLMSGGLHRLWKKRAIALSHLRPGQTVLDLAGGTGDLTALIKERIGKTGTVVLSDINPAMIAVGRDRLMDRGLFENIQFVEANAEKLPFTDHQFHRAIMGFGMRNVTHKDQALKELFRVLKPGGMATILEFSPHVKPGLKQLYDWYSFSILPKIGKYVAQDEASYRYLAESIRMHPDPDTFKTMMEEAGFSACDYHCLTGGIVVIHRGWKYA